MRVPLGVVFFIYESRPNVTTDAAAICIKSGNAVILRGGKEALRSNLVLAKVLDEAAAEAGLPDDAVQVLNTTDRAAIDEFLAMPEYIDVTIPRGGAQLIRRVADGAKMPVIKHFAGNCHVYIDAAADPDAMATEQLASLSARMSLTPSWSTSPNVQLNPAISGVSNFSSYAALMQLFSSSSVKSVRNFDMIS